MMSLSLISCQAGRINVKVRSPKEPLVLATKVVNNCVCGKALDNVIKNHLKAWRHIDELKAKGCFTK